MENLLLLLLVAPAPALALVLLLVRMPYARRRAWFPLAWRRPVWPGLVALAAVAAVLTVLVERGYLAAVPNGPRWGFDVALLGLVLALFATVGCAALAGLVSAAVCRTRGFGAGAVAGLLAIAAVAAGAAGAHLPLRAAYLADPQHYPSVANLPPGDLLMPFDAFLVTLIAALPWPVIGAALGAVPRPERVRDAWQLLLDLVTTDLPANRSAWGAALRAELTAIDPRAERRAFALGGAWTAVRSGAPPATWLLAIVMAFAVAGGSFAASRWSMTHGQGGILVFWLVVPGLLLLALAFATAQRSRSFGAGVRTGLTAMVAALVAVLAVGLPEAVVWANHRAGYLTTGDAVPPDWQTAIRDVLRPEFLLGLVVFWANAILSGAAFGSVVARLPKRPIEGLAGDPSSQG